MITSGVQFRAYNTNFFEVCLLLGEPDNATRYGLKPTTRWARWDSGNASPSHLSVTMYVPAFAIASGEMIASCSFFETKQVDSDAKGAENSQCAL